MFEWIKKHKKIFVIILVIVVIGSVVLVPAIIHILFNIYPKNEYFIAEWSAGELLGYYGSILSFLGTVILGALSLYQNHLLKIETDKRTALMEQREHEKNMPKFRVSVRSRSGKNTKLKIAISNITENNASDMTVYNIRMVCNDKVIWEISNNFFYQKFKGESEEIINLQNPSVLDANTMLLMEMKCMDKYFEWHNYTVRGCLEDEYQMFKFKVVEI